MAAAKALHQIGGLEGLRKVEEEVQLQGKENLPVETAPACGEAEQVEMLTDETSVGEMASMTSAAATRYMYADRKQRRNLGGERPNKLWFKMR